MEQKHKKNAILLFSLSIFTVGVIVLYSKVHTSLRSPAAISGITYSDLGESSSKEILKSTDIRLNEEVYTIAMGNNSKLCATYQNVTLIFTTPNMRVSGETPMLKINAVCQSTPSGAVAVQIPFKKIMQEKPGDIDVTLRRPASMSFQARNVIGFWPEYWVLTRVEFSGLDSKTSLIFNEKEVSQWTQNKISMEWK